MVCPVRIFNDVDENVRVLLTSFAVTKMFAAVGADAPPVAVEKNCPKLEKVIRPHEILPPAMRSERVSVKQVFACAGGAAIPKLKTAPMSAACRFITCLLI
jgi:hypothetical protein